MTSDATGDLTQMRELWRAPGAGPTLGVPHVYKAMANDTGQQFSDRCLLSRQLLPLRRSTTLSFIRRLGEARDGAD